MTERKFTVYDFQSDTVLASELTLEMLFTFLTGYYDRYYNETIQLTIIEENPLDDADITL